MVHQLKTILVFGASSEVGQRILDRGKHEELEVTAFVENKNKIPEDLRNKIDNITEGDVLDKKKVEEAVKGHDAILSALECGSSYRNHSTMSQACKNIIDGMKKHDVKRLIVVGTSSELQKTKGFFNKFKFYERNQDHARQISILEEEDDLDWIIMMPPEIKISEDINTDYKVQKDTVPGAHTVTSAELADFMVRVFKDTQSIECFRHCKLGISSHPKTKTSPYLIAALVVGAVAAAVIHFNPTAHTLWEHCYGNVTRYVFDKWFPEVLQEYLTNRNSAS